MIFFSLLYSLITLCNLYYFCCSNNVLLIIVEFCLSEIKFTYLISNQYPKINMLSTLYFENFLQVTIILLAKLKHRGEYTRHKEIWQNKTLHCRKSIFRRTHLPPLPPPLQTKRFCEWCAPPCFDFNFVSVKLFYIPLVSNWWLRNWNKWI